MSLVVAHNAADAFIARWTASSGAERANFQMFAIELCGVLGVTPPEPSRGEDAELNDYCFERGVQFKGADGTTSLGRIDLYKRGSFVMEAKQSREKGRPKEMKMAGQPDLFAPDYNPRGERIANRAWDQLMINARHQAQDYARALPVAHGWPPFVIVCDVGHCIEVYADFSGQGKNYAQFPDRRGFRVFLSDLRDENVRDRLKLIWDDSTALDPARQAAEVTRDISARLAQVSKRLEERGHGAEDVALFLMRCLFTMFAEDGELLPKDSFKELLTKCAADPSKFAPMVEQLWKAMDKGEFAYAIEQAVKCFNGKLFKDAKALRLEREDIGELHAAAARDWRKVEPAIFGTLLEQALKEKDRARLGAHYTPRAYVERLVFVTVIEPLRQEWSRVQTTAERFKIEADHLEQEAREAGSRAKLTAGGRSVSGEKARESAAKHDEAIAVLKGFHSKLCQTRVLDPACGTGNFLYVAMELMKRLEGEVLEAISDLAGPQDDLSWLASQTVDPHQFLGLELNPRAAAIAELVIWLGYLQWHFRTKGEAPPEPILHDFRNIRVMDAVLTWDGYPLPRFETRDGVRLETYPNARKPTWPEAEFIVGNPPFIGGKKMREILGDEYVETLWKAHPNVNESADFVMFWWDRAAESVAFKDSRVLRFGLVTTNSIAQMFNRRVVERHLTVKAPLSILMAIPDHPWTKATRDAAVVRIAMTVVARGRLEGVLREVVSETGLDTDQPQLTFNVRYGRINADLTVGVDITTVKPLRSNDGICQQGVKLVGGGFVVSVPNRSYFEARGRHVIKPYISNREMTGQRLNRAVIDFHGLDAEQARRANLVAYQRVLETVKPLRDRNREKSRREKWWLFGRSNIEMRSSLADLQRYIITPEVAKHRPFAFIEKDTIPDASIYAIALDDGWQFGVLTSRIHRTWSLFAGGTLEDRPRYHNTSCFDPFPFPVCSEELMGRIRCVAEELDAHRKSRQLERSRLTLTQMYNVLEKLKVGEPLDSEDERIKSDGLVLILKELHEKLDALVFEAYGWPATLSDEGILEHLVALNEQRAMEENVGNIKWLRPDYQIRRFGSDADRARLVAEKAKARAEQLGLIDDDDDDEEVGGKPKFPTNKELEETAAVMSALAASSEAMSVEQIARIFSQGKQIEKRVALTILALARLGHLSSDDAGVTFSLRRVA